MIKMLIVCEGNICRSPAAAALLDRLLVLQGGFATASAGTAPLEGKPMDPVFAERLRAAGVVPPSDHRSRRVTPEILRSADLILTSTRGQASDVVTVDVAALRRTFTLKGFARMLAVMRAQNLPVTTLDDILLQRGRLTPVHKPEDDIPDPYRADDSVGDAALSQILIACNTIASGLSALGAAA